MTDLSAVQRRTIAVLSVGQVLGGISFGATVSLGAVLAAHLSGSDALFGPAHRGDHARHGAHGGAAGRAGPGAVGGRLWRPA